MKNIIIQIICLFTVVTVVHAQERQPDDRRDVEITYQPSAELIRGEIGIWYKRDLCSDKTIDISNGGTVISAEGTYNQTFNNS